MPNAKCQRPKAKCQVGGFGIGVWALVGNSLRLLAPGAWLLAFLIWAALHLALATWPLNADPNRLPGEPGSPPTSAATTTQADEGTPRPPGQPKRIAHAENPHWRPDACDQCHQQSGGGADGRAKAAPGQPLPNLPHSPRNAEALCWSCHDGQRARGEAHPVSVAPAQANVTKPGDWPLVDGRLGCLTCHDVKLGCDKSAYRPAVNTVFLRGQGSTGSTGSTDGAAAPAEAFCKNCHNPQRYKRFNPHIMLDANGEIRASRCLVCHTQMPARTAKLRTGQPALRKDQNALCLDCHRPHPDMYAKGHMGSVLKPPMIEYINKHDIGVLQAQLKKAAGTGSLAQGSPASQPSGAAGQPGPAVPAAVTDIPLALDSQGWITCATCHNPHQQNTFSSDSVLGYGAMRLVSAAPERITSGARNKQLCEDCHDLGQLGGGKK